MARDTWRDAALASLLPGLISGLNFWYPTLRVQAVTTFR
jgi:hypothetical protein